jgi:Bifunctional DNA primase/polymerase, N-terminal/AAA domain
MNLTSPLDYALDMAARGWPVFPLFTPRQQPDGSWQCDCPHTYKADERCSPGKHPRTEGGFKAGSIDPDQIRKWWGRQWPHANIGVDLASARILDIAPDSVEHHEQFKTLGLPPTFTFRSGGGDGHLHYFYAIPEGVPQTRIPRPGEYDILSAGYAITPPSRHILGGLYEMVADLPLAEAPRWACERMIAQAARPKARIDVGGDVASDDEINRLVEQMDPLVWAGNRFIDRSTSLVAIAGDLSKLGANQATIVEILRERDLTLGFLKFANRRNAIEQYRRIAARAWEANPPNAHPSRKAVPGSRGGVEQRNSISELRFWTAADLSGRELEETKWYCHGILGPGLLTELDGWAKLSGKTTFALAMIRAILDGEPFIGLETASTPVVYLTEQTWQSLVPNLDKAGLLQSTDLRLLFYPEARGVAWNDVVERAGKEALDRGAGIIVVDTLAQWTGLRGESENASGVAYQALEALQGLASEGLAVLILRHDRKSGGEVSLSARGSSAYAAAMDVILHLTPNPTEGASPRQRVLEGTGRFADDTPGSVIVELGTDVPLTYVNLGEPQEVEDRNDYGVVIDALPRLRDRALTSKEVCDVVGVRRESVLKVLHESFANGTIERDGTGKRGDAYRYWIDRHIIEVVS